MLEIKQKVWLSQAEADDPTVGGCIACGYTITCLGADEERFRCPNEDCGEHHAYGHNKLEATGMLHIIVPVKKNLSITSTSPTPTLTPEEADSQARRDLAWKHYEDRVDILFARGSITDSEAEELEDQMDALMAEESMSHADGDAPWSQSQYDGV